MNLDTGRVHLYKTAHHERLEQDYRERVVDIAMATAAAPTYFRPHLTEAGTPLIDGGVFANNPAGLAAVEAFGLLGWERNDLLLLGLGCGTEPLNVRSRGWLRSGAAYLGGTGNVVDIFMAAQSDASTRPAIDLLGSRDDCRAASAPRPQRDSISLATSSPYRFAGSVGWIRTNMHCLICERKDLFSQRAAPFTSVYTL